MPLHVGVARTRLSPPWGVELAGWGYYLGRAWRQVRDHTSATALVIDDGARSAAVIATDLMYLDADFTEGVRRRVSAETGLLPGSICVACSHSHNTPTAALIRGAGEMDHEYLAWAQRQTATAAIMAWRQRQEAVFRVGKADVPGWTYNRTRDGGDVDTRLGLWRFDTVDGRPLAAVVNFQAHPVVMMCLGASHLCRDAPGQITDILEAAVPGLTALYLQGACGDVNFHLRYHEPAHCHEPGRHVAAKALEAFANALPSPPYEGGTKSAGVAAHAVRVTLPTRRWTRDEVHRDREEGLYRLQTGDTNGWRENIGRVMVNFPDRFPERYGGDLGLAVQAIARFAVEWTQEMLKDVDTRPETLPAEVQAIRVHDAYLVANPAELFTSFALDLRKEWLGEGGDDLLIAGYANDSIGYLPDGYDIEKRTYAADQSPKFKNQFPFTPESGPALVRGMIEALRRARPE